MNKFSPRGSFGRTVAQNMSTTRSPSGAPPILQADPVDIDYLNSAWHPTHYAWAQRRRDALDRCLYLASAGTQQVLDGNSRLGQFNLGLVERYKTLYQFTHEEINVRCTETESYVQGSSGA